MEMTKQREFSTLSPKQNMNIWKMNLNSLPAPAPKHTVFPSRLWYFFIIFFTFLWTFPGIVIYLPTLQTASTVLLACSYRFTVKSNLIQPVCLSVSLTTTQNENPLPSPHIQGCESEITSMVAEARRKSSQCLDAALLALSHLAAMTGVQLSAMERGAQATGKVTPPLIPQQPPVHVKAPRPAVIKPPLHNTLRMEY